MRVETELKSEKCREFVMFGRLFAFVLTKYETFI